MMTKQLIIMLLHGPGGSGKMTAIDLLMASVKDYCESLVNVEFMCQTIVVTALSGVAATLLS